VMYFFFFFWFTDLLLDPTERSAIPHVLIRRYSSYAHSHILLLCLSKQRRCRSSTKRVGDLLLSLFL
jgi:hypothetical protein